VAKSLGEYEAETLTKWTGTRLRIETRIQSFIDKKLKQVNLTMAQRIKVATQFLRDAVAVNLSRPVRKIKKSSVVVDPQTGSKTTKTRTVVDPASRSKRGEFPRADTTRLMKDIFTSISPDGLEGKVGTTLLYGLVLETKLDRSFLRRTMNERRSQIISILLHGENPLPGQVTGTGE
jgi:hypothetical protein